MYKESSVACSTHTPSHCELLDLEQAQCWRCHSVRLRCVQGEAIAMNLREMFGIRVPILSVVIGEGGSGGALAIGCANRNLIMEHSVYYVASPEACAAILWKARDKAATVSRFAAALCWTSVFALDPASHFIRHILT